MKPNISNLVDYRTEFLWKKLNSLYEIELEYFQEKYYSVYSINNSHTIYISTFEPENKASFAHELLHIELDRLDLSFPTGFGTLIKGSKSTANWFSDSLSEHFMNCCNHIKMLPLFLNLGFNAEDFISDYNENKLTDSEIVILSGLKRGDNYVGIYLDFFIAKFIAVKACPNENMNYPVSLERLKRIEPQLYDILDDFYHKWFELENSNNILKNPRTLMFDLFFKLESWAKSKNIN